MEEKYYCQYCRRECKNLNSLRQHEIRCKQNPNKIQCKSNFKNKSKQINKSNDKARIGRHNEIILDITNAELEKYRESQLTCEICGRTIEESVKWKSKFAAKNFCVDHDHETNKFRGLLCQVCNRQLGWYEKHRKNIALYLNKDNK